MRTLSRLTLIGGLLLALGSAPLAFAAITPTLSFTSAGDGTTVQITVNGEPTAGVTLDYTLTDMVSRQRALGTTDANGSFTTSVKSSDLGLVAGTIMDVRVKKTDGPEMQSQYVPWPQLGTANTSGATTAATQTTNTAGMTLSQTAITVQLSGNTTLTVNGGSSPFLVFTASDGISSGTVQDRTVTIYGLNAGSSNGSVCSVTGTCVPFTVSVTNAAPAPVIPVVTTVVPTATVSSGFAFTSTLAAGSQGTEVLELQKLLVTLGYLTATPNGNYGPQTQAAVSKFQLAHGLPQLGIVGPATRVALNTVSGGSIAATVPTTSASAVSQLATPIASMSVVELRTVVASLVTQLAQIANRLAQLGG